MYREVVTVNENEIFKEIFTEGFNEKNYELTEEYYGVRKRYLIEDNLGGYAGTLEFGEFNPKLGSLMVEPEVFLTHPLVQNTPFEKIWEIDKLTVRADKRKSGVLKRTITSLFEIVDSNDVELLIAEMNPVLCRALRIEFKINVTKLSGIVRTPNYSYIPVIIPFKELKEKFIADNLLGVHV